MLAASSQTAGASEAAAVKPETAPACTRVLAAAPALSPTNGVQSNGAAVAPLDGLGAKAADAAASVSAAPQKRRRAAQPARGKRLRSAEPGDERPPAGGAAVLTEIAPNQVCTRAQRKGKAPQRLNL